jgi:hypothetical protein
MSASVGCGLLASSAAADMICPDWQYPWRRMRQYRALLRGQGTSIVDLYWAGCIINMSGFDLRQTQPIIPPKNAGAATSRTQAARGSAPAMGPGT